MSVGGEVLEVIPFGDKIFINTIEKIRSDDGFRYGAKCAINVEKDGNSVKVKPGDIVWWQGNKAYWTTKDRKTEIETILKRVGFSGVNRPSRRKL